jgi:hypothetical protein
MKHRLRRLRENQALAILHRLPSASALDIGTAAVQGEPRSVAMPLKARAAIGLSIAIELVRRGLASPTRNNRFSLPRADRANDATNQSGSKMDLLYDRATRTNDFLKNNQ